MQQLWAPWRMPYLQNTAPEPGCLFCAKARADEDESNLIVYRDELVFIILNLFPYNSGHLMVVPYQHTGTLTELEPAAGAAVLEGAKLAQRALDAVMKPEGFNLGINQGAVAGAGIADHLHLHIVPRWSGDTNFMPVLADAKVMPELLASTAAKLRPVFARLRPAL